LDESHIIKVINLKMSSDKRRIKLRLKRLQETFQSLGKDPNAKGNDLTQFS
jgi:hypothetical protein